MRAKGKSIAAVLSAYAQAHGYTQTDLARLFKVSQGSISRWYSGGRTPRDRRTRRRLMAMGVDPSWL